VEGLDSQAYTVHPVEEAGFKKDPVRRFGVCLNGKFPGFPRGKKFPEIGKKPAQSGSKDRRSAAAYIHRRYRTGRKTAQDFFRLPKDSVYEQFRSLVPVFQGKGIKITIIADTGAEGNVNIEGDLHRIRAGQAL
jgi:hypothetical protein